MYNVWRFFFCRRRIAPPKCSGGYFKHTLCFSLSPTWWQEQYPLFISGGICGLRADNLGCSWGGEFGSAVFNMIHPSTRVSSSVSAACPKLKKAVASARNKVWNKANSSRSPAGYQPIHPSMWSKKTYWLACSRVTARGLGVYTSGHKKKKRFNIASLHAN